MGRRQAIRAQLAVLGLAVLGYCRAPAAVPDHGGPDPRGLLARLRAPALPTRLANVLRAAEIHAGGRYGLDIVVAFPSPVPAALDRTATAWEDLTDQLGTTVLTCISFLLATVIFGTLVSDGWNGGWLLIRWSPGRLPGSPTGRRSTPPSSRARR